MTTVDAELAPLARRWQGAALALIAVCAMGLVLGNGWVQDEGPLILQDPRVHAWSGLWSGFVSPWWPEATGGGLYRPLARTLLTLQWMAGGGAPWAFKLGSLLCYLAAVAAVWTLARRLLPGLPAWIVAALFAAHPVHTEAVAVAVNQGEALVTAVLCAAAALWLDQRAGRRALGPTAVTIALLYLAGLGLKEHALLLPVLLFVAGAAVPRVAGTGQTSRRREWGVLLGLVAIGAAVWAARTAILGGAVSAPPAHGLPVEPLPRALTMLGVVPHWVRLLLWPAHLQADYAPLEILPWGGWTVMHSLGTGLLALAAGLLAWSWPRRRVVAAGILWTAVALFPVSNLAAVTGIVLAERTLMLASVGAILAVIAAVPDAWWHTPRTRTPLAALAGALVLVGAFRSAARMPDWHDPVRYVIALSRDAPRSWHTLDAVGTLELEAGHRAEGEARLRAAMAIAPWHSRAYRTLARAYRSDGLCAAAIPLLETTLRLEPIDQYSRLSLVACLLDQARYDEARARAVEGAAGPGRALQAAFRAATLTADSAARARAGAGRVRLAPFPGGYTDIGAPPGDTRP
ncbi:MAG TPA: hypothetical protein VFS07_03505 [Gemmatimonadales bacterium]|nr:hypothetical protein [Gemmatimonadales bacterium]